MATKKPTKAQKKSSSKPKSEAVTAKPEAKKSTTKPLTAPTVKPTPAAKSPTPVTSAPKGPRKLFKGFFSKRFDPNENAATIFKTPKIWGAILGELVGTLFLSVMLLTMGVQPLFMFFGFLGITMVVFALSGANLNPAITAGLMASRRMSAIRGVLYIIAQIFGAWIGLLIVNAFRLGSQTELPLPHMVEVVGDNFWQLALVEFVGLCFIGFFFARATHYKRSTLTFASIVAGGVVLATIFGIVVAQQFFQAMPTEPTFVFNPAIALMYQILPTSAADFGSLMGSLCLSLLAYVIFPMLGSFLGFGIADLAARLRGEEKVALDC